MILPLLGGLAFVLAGVAVLGNIGGTASFMHRTYRQLGGPYPKALAYTRLSSGTLMLAVGAGLLWLAYAG